MVHSRPASFRRILLFQILLLSVPILLIGQYTTLRKARTSLLETARQNLISSAMRKSDSLTLGLESLQSSILVLTQTTALQTGTVAEASSTLTSLSRSLPFQLDCVQLLAVETNTAIINTCNQPQLLKTAPDWPQSAAANPATDFHLTAVPTANLGKASDHEAHLTMAIAAPVYTPAGRLRYTLSLQAQLTQVQNAAPRSLVGYTVVIDDAGQILVHPDSSQQGKNIRQLQDANRLNSIVSNVRAGNSEALHLFNFDTSSDEWIAGYSGLEITVAPGDRRLWTVLAVTPLDHSLQALKDIRQILLVLTVGLLIANALLALYMARRLSLPIENLSFHAQKIQDLSQIKQAPQEFKIRELDHLSQVLTCMMKRLEERAQELHHAWQDAQLANQLKSEFLANTSHELRTPLNAIIGCIRLVRDGCCDDRAEELEFLNRADQAAIHLLKIINDILDIAKIESGTLALALEPIELGAIIQEVVELQTLQIQQKGLSLMAPTLSQPVWINGDRNKLKQVLLNILYNAIKFTEEGTISVQVNYLSSPAIAAAPEPVKTDATDTDFESRPTHVMLTIQDTGIGIDPSNQKKLFRPFVMVDGSTTRRFEGTGLGLAISKNLVELMNGSITLMSEGVGRGTSVQITLPLLVDSEILYALQGSQSPQAAEVKTASPHSVP
ncbi:MAG: two-component sensor histidine kinase [Leptolyngbyaceae cyanobacterium RM1_1_2]|nr:two-component sensor histidine kinase [Leptolyngbyaceae cyanobacterium RM1_1_2]